MNIFTNRSLYIVALLVALWGVGAFAQTSPSALYVPLIGITAVPEPLALPAGPGKVTYHYAVKNFLQSVPLTDVSVTDDTCSPVIFAEGDDNKDGKLDYAETWRYTCSRELLKTTESIATATGAVNAITATHTAHATVVVGSNVTPPLVSIVNITKVASPLSLPAEGGTITYTYKVSNPGVVPLSAVRVTDDTCSTMSGKLGDTNANNLLDPTEVWIYTCSTRLTQTTTNTATVTAVASGLTAVGSATLTAVVATTSNPASNLFDVSISPVASPSNVAITLWVTLVLVVVALTIFFLVNRKGKRPGHLVLPETDVAPPDAERSKAP